MLYNLSYRLSLSIHVESMLTKTVINIHCHLLCCVNGSVVTWHILLCQYCKYLTRILVCIMYQVLRCLASADLVSGAQMESIMRVRILGVKYFYSHTCHPRFFLLWEWSLFRLPDAAISRDQGVNKTDVNVFIRINNIYEINNIESKIIVRFSKSVNAYTYICQPINLYQQQ